jgi:prohibitin 1
MKATIIKSEGESEAARLISDAIQEFGPGLVQLRKIEAAHNITNKLAVNPNITFLSGNGSVNMM